MTHLTDSLGRRVDFKTRSDQTFTWDAGIKDRVEESVRNRSPKGRVGARKTTIEEASTGSSNRSSSRSRESRSYFHPLAASNILASLFSPRPDQALAAQGVTLGSPKQAPGIPLSEKGYDAAYGRRPLRRAVQKYLEDPIAEELLKGKYPEGSVIRVKVNKKTDELRFTGALTEKGDGDVEEEEKSAEEN